ncbi:TauD/TfdA family dioxygenase [Streptomyces cyaneochromogenes]|uniref:TauD/TfdA family dioxygenase n=1 Tax=Streptomyces cyaneochromogenes TaxID=2496836 RepID=A0A3Q9END8_9ACTN|nr:TauD/TfdA family dioxygenase [Streptomyces cyaneochromogenes]AZQ32231.1 TauD/TfdA family dioxygenase [Streptomyces cyaneochromogenes]
MTESRPDEPELLARLTAAPGSDPEIWLDGHLDEIRESVARHGAVLVRGLPLDDRARAVAAVRRVIGTGMVEREGFAPRAPYGRAAGVYSSSHWPADQPMCMHHELSYAAETPSLLAFACVTPPSSGGVTALADSRAVLRDLPAELVDRFERHGWLLTRHYNPFLGIGWQDAFDAKDRTEVERYCADHGITAHWDEEGGLRTRQIRSAVVPHPVSGERCWFNQIAFLNEWTMAPDVREFLTSEFGPEGLPFNTFYGDGSPLDRATVDLINEVYERHTVREPWQHGDVMVVDNFRTAHSREPYQGEREIVVGLGEPLRR